MADSNGTTALLKLVTERLFIALLTVVFICLAFSAAVTYAGWPSDPQFLRTARQTVVTGFSVPALVMGSGAIGGFVSLQRRLKNLTVADLELLSSSRVYIWLAPLVGGVLALLLYILFLSGLIRGDLFPAFEADNDLKNIKGILSLPAQYASNGYADYAKLLFWSFVAGFSENFVTNIIGRFEGDAVNTVPVRDEPEKEPSPPGSGHSATVQPIDQHRPQKSSE